MVSEALDLHPSFFFPSFFKNQTAPARHHWMEDSGERPPKKQRGDPCELDAECSSSERQKQIVVEQKKTDSEISDMLKVLLGIKVFFPWQSHMMKPGNSNGSFVLGLETSAGKSVIGDFVMLKCLEQEGKSALVILPFRSLVQARRDDYLTWNLFPVNSYFSQHCRFPIPEGKRILVATPERAHAIIDHLSRSNRIHELGCVVLDEVHMIAEDDRGTCLELLMAKIRLHLPDVQLVGMSATAPNLDELARWMNGRPHTFPDCRPVKLHRYAVVGGKVMDSSSRLVRTLMSQDDDQKYSWALELVREVLDGDGSVLVFARSKFQCEAMFAALKNAFPFARIGIHHGGLPDAERAVIETSFRLKKLRVLCATTTLATGVNLPARRVIILEPYVGAVALGKGLYTQMCGRAGRYGLDSYDGEAYLISPKGISSTMVYNLVCEGHLVAPIVSCLHKSPPRVFQRALLECISIGAMRDTASVSRWKALLFSSAGDEVEKLTNDAMQQLIEWKLVVVVNDANAELLSCSPVGHAIAQIHWISVSDGMARSTELQRGEDLAMTMKGTLCFTIYLLAWPAADEEVVHWRALEKIIDRIDAGKEHESLVQTLNEVNPCRFTLDQKCNASGVLSNPSGLATLLRLWNALLLSSVLDGYSCDELAVKFGMPSADVRKAVDSALTSAESTAELAMAIPPPSGGFPYLVKGLLASIAKHAKRLNIEREEA